MIEFGIADFVNSLVIIFPNYRGTLYFALTATFIILGIFSIVSMIINYKISRIVPIFTVITMILLLLLSASEPLK